MAWHKVVLLGLAAVCATLPAQAQWKWKDASGQMHVSDLPPPRDVPAKDILTRPEAAQRRAPAPAPAPASAAGSGVAEGKAAVDPELEARRKRADQEQTAKSRADDEKVAAQKADNCQRARSNASTLESGVRVVRANDKGEREFLDDKTRADELARARQVIASDCR